MWRTPPEITEGVGVHEELSQALAAVLNPHALSSSPHRFVSEEISVPLTITIGGVTLGGSGKTQAALALAQRLIAIHGVNVAILCHGYRGQSQKLGKPHRIVRPLICGDLSYGDEVAMLDFLLPPACSLWAGGTWETRWKAAQEAGNQIIICDGGLYHKDLPRSLGILMIPTPLSCKLLPFGDLSRPHYAWPDRSGYAWWYFHRAGQVSHRVYRSQNPSRHAFTHDFILQAKRWVNAHRESRILSEFVGQKVNVVTAIARPQAFVGMLEMLGVHCVEHIHLRDHSPLPHRLVQRINTGEQVWVTTLKDLVKLSPSPQSHLWALDTEMVTQEVDILGAP